MGKVENGLLVGNYNGKKIIVKYILHISHDIVELWPSSNPTMIISAVLATFFFHGLTSCTVP